MRTAIIASVFAAAALLTSVASAEGIKGPRRPLVTRTETLVPEQHPLLARTEKLTPVKRPLVAVA